MTEVESQSCGRKHWLPRQIFGIFGNGDMYDIYSHTRLNLYHGMPDTKARSRNMNAMPFVFKKKKILNCCVDLRV